MSHGRGGEMIRSVSQVRAFYISSSKSNLEALGNTNRGALLPQAPEVGILEEKEKYGHDTLSKTGILDRGYSKPLDTDSRLVC